MDQASDKKAATINDVAARAGVSRALVSIVLRGVPGASDANRARVVQAAKDLSYRPDQRARLLGRNRSTTFGVTFGLRDETHGELVEALYRSSALADYELMLSPVAPTRHESDATQSLLDYRCEGLILIGSSLGKGDLETLADRVPIVLITRTVRSNKIDVVRTDDIGGARLAVDHLVQLGHRNIAHVHGGRVAGAADRRTGYRQAMRHAGLDAYITMIEGGRTEDDGWHAARSVIAAGSTAVFAYNDQSAAGLIEHLRTEAVTVPETVSVVGYDNSRLARSPAFSMTTVAQDSDCLAQRALELLTSRRGTPHTDAEHVVARPRLITRNTTTTPKTSVR